jgi:hypothetical protein
MVLNLKTGRFDNLFFQFLETAHIRINNLFAIGEDFVRMRIGFIAVVAVAPIRDPGSRTSPRKFIRTIFQQTVARRIARKTSE